MPRTPRFDLQRPSDQDLWDAATSGNWSACADATEADLLRPLHRSRLDPPPTTVYMAFEAKRLQMIPPHLLTQRVLNSLWVAPASYSCSIMREFELGGELGDWGCLEPLLLTTENACRPVNDRGQTCLHIAARHRHLHTVPIHMLSLRGMFLPDRTAMTPMALADDTDLDQLVPLFTRARCDSE